METQGLGQELSPAFKKAFLPRSLFQERLEQCHYFDILSCAFNRSKRSSLRQSLFPQSRVQGWFEWATGQLLKGSSPALQHEHPPEDLHPAQSFSQDSKIVWSQSALSPALSQLRQVRDIHRTFRHDPIWTYLPFFTSALDKWPVTNLVTFMRLSAALKVVRETKETSLEEIGAYGSRSDYTRPKPLVWCRYIWGLNKSCMVHGKLLVLFIDSEKKKQWQQN